MLRQRETRPAYRRSSDPVLSPTRKLNVFDLDLLSPSGSGSPELKRIATSAPTEPDETYAAPPAPKATAAAETGLKRRGRGKK